MKTFTFICILVLGVGLAAGASLEELNSVSPKCQQCLTVLSLVRASRDLSELAQDLIGSENGPCESVCSQDYETGDAYVQYVSLKDCQMCVTAVNKINSHYLGSDPHALASSLSFACTMFQFACKNFIKANGPLLVRLLQSSKDAHVVCRGVHKC